MSRNMQYLEEIQLAAYRRVDPKGEFKRRHAKEFSFITQKNHPTHRRTLDTLKTLLGKPFLNPRKVRVSRKDTKKLMERYSKFESPIFANTIDRARTIAENALREIHEEAKIFKHDAKIIDTIVFGSMPSVLLNAAAIRVPKTDEYVIVMNEGMPRFLARMARIILRADAAISLEGFERLNLRAEGWEDGFRDLVKEAIFEDEHDYLIDHTVAAVCDYFGISIGLAYDHDVYRSFDRLMAEIVTTGAEVFVIAHEYSHVLNGHLVSWTAETLTMLDDEVEVGDRAPGIEHHADISAMTAILHAGNLDPIELGFLADSNIFSYYLERGPQHFFICADILEKSAKLLFGTVPNHGTHPPGHERFEILRELTSSEDNNVAITRYAIVAEELQDVALKLLGGVYGKNR